MRIQTTLAFALAALLSLPSLAQEPAAPPKKHEVTKAGTIDCSKTPDVHIGNGKLNLVFTGRCNSISIAGGKNEIVADTVVSLEIAGAHNHVFVSRVDSVQLIGAKNTITWAGVVDPKLTEPAVKHVGKDNVVKKGDQAAFDAAKKLDGKKVNAEAKKAEDEAKKAVDDAAKALGGFKLN